MTGGPGRDRTHDPTRPGPAFSPTIEKVLAATRPVVSLDSPSKADYSTSIGEFLIRR